VLVVDDASPDGTGAVADELAKASRGRVIVIHRTGERGLGRAYLDGLRHALRTDEAALLCQMDADLSHRPVDLVRLLDAASHADLVIGSRYVPGGRIENWPWRRRALSAIANRYVRRVCGLSPRDCTSGFRVWRRQTLMALPLDRIHSEGYAFLVELLWEAKRAGAHITESPITFVERRHGVSKLRLPILVESVMLPWSLRFRDGQRKEVSSAPAGGHGRTPAS